jgi:hypothetical protein|tara:strand:+ start:115 stop:531 length:417 start_codon:yes stop_codon:yes gene_type:complete
MLVPFDHITICDFEFVLHYKHSGEPMIGRDSPEWHAIDPYGNKVVIREKEMVKLPSMAYDGDTRLFRPTFYRYCKDNPSISHRITSEKMSLYVGEGVQTGSYTDSEGCDWHWDIPNRTITNDDIQYTLEVFSTGGWWI